MKKIFRLNNTALFSMSVALMLSACSNEESFGELESQKVVSEINIKVSDPLPLLINTDSLVAYEVLPEDASNKNVIWTSADEEIASVDPDGRIHANGFGSVFITVAPEIGFAGMKTFEVKVIDKINPITDIRITNEDLSMFVSTSLQLKTEYSPADATYSSLTWSSLTPDIATVDENGLVRGLAVGNAVIRVASRDGGNYFKDVNITVREVVPVSEITFAPGQQALAMYETSRFNITVGPDGATAETVRWYSADTKVVSINEETGIFYVKGNGSTVITAKSGDVEATLEVTVQPGKINDDFSFGATNWRGFGKDYSTAEIKDGKFVVTPGSNSKASIERIYDTEFHVGNYPILAIKKTEPNTTYSMAIDMWTDKDYGKFKGSVEQLVDPADNVPVSYIDMTSASFGSMSLPTTQSALLDVFVYRMENFGTTENVSYEVYWIKTFKSVDELKAYLGISSAE